MAIEIACGAAVILSAPISRLGSMGADRAVLSELPLKLRDVQPTSKLRVAGSNPAGVANLFRGLVRVPPARIFS
jgi:hypothetical protein